LQLKLALAKNALLTAWFVQAQGLALNALLPIISIIQIKESVQFVEAIVCSAETMATALSVLVKDITFWMMVIAILH